MSRRAGICRAARPSIGIPGCLSSFYASPFQARRHPVALLSLAAATGRPAHTYTSTLARELLLGRPRATWRHKEAGRASSPWPPIGWPISWPPLCPGRCFLSAPVVAFSFHCTSPAGRLPARSPVQFSSDPIEEEPPPSPAGQPLICSCRRSAQPNRGPDLGSAVGSLRSSRWRHMLLHFFNSTAALLWPSLASCYGAPPLSICLPARIARSSLASSLFGPATSGARCKFRARGLSFETAA